MNKTIYYCIIFSILFSIVILILLNRQSILKTLETFTNAISASKRDIPDTDTLYLFYINNCPYSKKARKEWKKMIHLLKNVDEDGQININKTRVQLKEINAEGTKDEIKLSNHLKVLDLPKIIFRDTLGNVRIHNDNDNRTAQSIKTFLYSVAK